MHHDCAQTYKQFIQFLLHFPSVRLVVRSNVNVSLSCVERDIIVLNPVQCSLTLPFCSPLQHYTTSLYVLKYKFQSVFESVLTWTWAGLRLKGLVLVRGPSELKLGLKTWKFHQQVIFNSTF